jgi:hypothetical protein
MEELLTGELSEPDVTARASELLAQLDAGDRDHGAARPDATEMGATALRTLALPEIAGIRSHLAPETPFWAEEGSALLAGRADALLIRGDVVEVAVDWAGTSSRRQRRGRRVDCRGCGAALICAGYG